MTSDLCFEVFTMGIAGGIFVKLSVDVIFFAINRLSSIIRNIF
jgi:hypothetical protein